MGNVTSMDLRGGIVQAVEVECVSRRDAAERFMVSALDRDQAPKA